jgi:hypothetical protein
VLRACSAASAALEIRRRFARIVQMARAIRSRRRKRRMASACVHRCAGQTQKSPLAQSSATRKGPPFMLTMQALAKGRITGFRPQHTVEDAIKEIVSMYRQGVLSDDDRWYNLKWMQATVLS